uniref:Uncharacterized protein n=1 Tax=Anguilla anguilla TaxID=7936 RepID=A0A0E9WP63_ANGAN
MSRNTVFSRHLEMGSVKKMKSFPLHASVLLVCPKFADTREPYFRPWKCELSRSRRLRIEPQPSHC